MIFLRQWGWAWLLIAFSFTAFYASGIDNGVSHDRLKYLSIGWGMYHSGNYFIPMVNGEMYTDKPPLIFWLIATFWHLFGVGIFSVTLMISLVLVGWGMIIRAMYATLFPNDLLGKNMIAVLLLGSCIIWKDPWFLRVDMLLVLGVSLCNLGILQSMLSSSSIKALKNEYSFFYMALGTFIGLFSKGPIFYIFTLLPFCLTLMFNKENRFCAVKVLRAIFLGTFVMLISWVIPAIIFMGSEFAHQVLYQQITHRALHVDASPIQKKPYLIYLYQYMPMLFFPWIINL
ncbi:MAG: hypothetical protein LRY69_00810 [Gammaproteobacteria bacterium]|nr:hypothetical protein [Gammaproteobacteria bacterium]